ncbi:hypothetical protein [Kitasatospora sp. MAP5-34]|uniref:hypothetical protein n=1 Tax=Kitasatospora sp. MAP5-34 TaxID=3035102 RepID=UPI0024744287|nr:hypothetical protein [Kitasatospora sp. MAP5-34]MDH6580732.1 hypothetical protein [Kitasatospora sp. MAP5-34]
MTTHQNASTDLPRLRALTATVLATALAGSLVGGNRFADAHRAIYRATFHGTYPPGHAELVRRESTYRLAYAAQLSPRGLLAPGPGTGLDSRDRAWPSRIRRTALLGAITQLPATPDRALLTQGQPLAPPAVTTNQLTTTLHSAARQAATDLRSARTRTLAEALTIATRYAARDLPAGYDLLLERETTLRLALTLALPTTGALAPALDLALAHTTSHSTRTELADLLLQAVRPAPVLPVTAPVTHSRLGQVPRQRALTGTCPCVCASGGFCGGCGHAGCGRR